jgi:hypothetical protein
VLKSHATGGFYVGGNTPWGESVNNSFFGVNIAFLLFPVSLLPLDNVSFFLI